MGLELSWARHAFSLELRKILSYRADFWVNFLGTALGEIGIAYFLWSAIFSTRGVETIGGYSFKGMMFYYVLVPLLGRMIRGNEMGFVSQEIYEGGLTRYLVYPIPFFGYKFARNSAQAFVYGTQLLAAIGVYVLLFGLPAEVRISPVAWFGGFIAVYAASYVYFMIAASLEMVAFWQDNVWSLLVMLRFSLSLFGGGLIPLTLFPDAFRETLRWLPFEYLMSFPLRVFLGQADALEWVRGMGMLALWALLASGVAALIWHRGTRQYSGVGM